MSGTSDVVGVVTATVSYPDEIEVDESETED